MSKRSPVPLLPALLGTLLSLGGCQPPPPLDAQSGSALQSTALADGWFNIRTPGDYCIDPDTLGNPHDGSSVYISPCVTRLAIHVVELDASHDVSLKTDDDRLCLTVEGPVFSGQPVRLRPCNSSPAQRFALDGDSILVGTQGPGEPVNRRYVVQVHNGLPHAHTPLVVGDRDLDDAERWTFTAADGSALKPTGGFVTATTREQITEAVGRGWGTVVEVPDGLIIDMAGTPDSPTCSQDGSGQWWTEPVTIGPGVTLRSTRRGRSWGATLFFSRLCTGPVFRAGGDHVRLTGLLLKGPTNTENKVATTHAFSTYGRYRVIVDHNEMEHFPHSDIYVVGVKPDCDPSTQECELDDNGNPIADDPDDHRDGNDRKVCPVPPQPTERTRYVRVVRNFLHHNHMDTKGYGVDVGTSAFASIEANVFSSNRHSIAADYHAGTGYRAYDNLVLSPAPSYKWGFVVHQDFDMHGSDNGSHYTGGRAGDFFDIQFNTFFGTNRPNVELRGKPCHYLDLENNVSVTGSGDFFKRKDADDAVVVNRLNHNDVENPTHHLAVGDFDGDGYSDVFMATGADWYYSSGGQMEWRQLKQHPSRVSDLRFGDFNGDGRTDVFWVRDGDWLISWGGQSAWEKVNDAPGNIADFRVGDFDGDRRADIFYGDGKNWFFSSGARSPWQWLNTSVARGSQVLIGDFDGDIKSDIFAATGGSWKYSSGGRTAWTALRSIPINLSGSPVIADIDGNGIADVVWSVLPTPSNPTRSDWYISRDGHGEELLRVSVPALAGAMFGRFNGDALYHALEWNDNHLNLIYGARTDQGNRSLQKLR